MQHKCKLCGTTENLRRHGKYIRNICQRCYGRRERVKLKYDMLEALGYKCACCGEPEVRFLTLDHVNNDGSKHRAIYNEQQIYRLAKREGWPKDKYQVLCMNCNWAKGQYGKCPHKDGP